MKLNSPWKVRRCWLIVAFALTTVAGCGNDGALSTPTSAVVVDEGPTIPFQSLLVFNFSSGLSAGEIEFMVELFCPSKRNDARVAISAAFEGWRGKPLPSAESSGKNESGLYYVNMRVGQYRETIQFEFDETEKCVMSVSNELGEPSQWSP